MSESDPQVAQPAPADVPGGEPPGAPQPGTAGGAGSGAGRGTGGGFIRSRGLRFPDDPSVLTARLRRLLRSNGYERKEFEAVRALVGPDDTVLELGAGIGFMSTVAAKRCGARRVVSYEANPALIPYIRAVHQANGVSDRTEVRNALLAGRKGKPVDFHIRRNLLASSLDAMQGDSDGGVVATEKVEVHGIGSVLREVKPTVLICDIEGAEADLLPRADLSCLRLAIVELHPQWIGQAGVQAVFDAMQRGGLTYFPKRSNAKVVAFRKEW